jgi:hypothetical protein
MLKNIKSLFCCSEKNSFISCVVFKYILHIYNFCISFFKCKIKCFHVTKFLTEKRSNKCCELFFFLKNSLFDIFGEIDETLLRTNLITKQELKKNENFEVPMHNSVSFHNCESCISLTELAVG